MNDPNHNIKHQTLEPDPTPKTRNPKTNQNQKPQTHMARENPPRPPTNHSKTDPQKPLTTPWTFPSQTRGREIPPLPLKYSKKPEI